MTDGVGKMAVETVHVKRDSQTNPPLPAIMTPALVAQISEMHRNSPMCTNVRVLARAEVGASQIGGGREARGASVSGSRPLLGVMRGTSVLACWHAGQRCSRLWRSFLGSLELDDGCAENYEARVRAYAHARATELTDEQV